MKGIYKEGDRVLVRNIQPTGQVKHFELLIDEVAPSGGFIRGAGGTWYELSDVVEILPTREEPEDLTPVDPPAAARCRKSRQEG